MKTKRWFFLMILVWPFSAPAQEVSKADWIDGMSTALPTAFCHSEQYFRQCFDISAEECEEVATSATRVCLNKYRDEIPDTLVQPRDGTRWGTSVDSCAGEAYEATLSGKRIDNPQCNDPANWQ